MCSLKLSMHCFQLMLVGYLLDTVETQLAKDVNRIIDRYAKCQNAAAKGVHKSSNLVLRELDECLKNSDYDTYDYKVFFGK